LIALVADIMHLIGGLHGRRDHAASNDCAGESQCNTAEFHGQQTGRNARCGAGGQQRGQPAELRQRGWDMHANISVEH
jgi:hypothetical protein